MVQNAASGQSDKAGPQSRARQPGLRAAAAEGPRLEYVEAVLEVAALIPPGKVLSYGDIADLLGSGGPRQVGKAMSKAGAAVCWWRVLRSNGTLPPELQARAQAHWDVEGTPQRAAGVLINVARWQPDEPGHRRIDAVAELLPVPNRRTPLI